MPPSKLWIKICVNLWNLWDKIFIRSHGWIGRQSCLSDYSRIFAELWPLANGWRPICAAIVFGHADFANDAEFSSWGILSHRFHRFTQIFLNLRRIALSDPRGYLQRPNRSPPRNSVSNRLSKKSPNKFRVIRWIKKICVICEICVTKKTI